jgi:hypothetical protein
MSAEMKRGTMYRALRVLAGRGVLASGIAR